MSTLEIEMACNLKRVPGKIETSLEQEFTSVKGTACYLDQTDQ